MLMNFNTILMEAKWDQIISIFNFDIEKEKILKFILKYANMKTIGIFKHLTQIRLIEICKKITKKVYEENQIIFEEGSKGDYLYIVYKGSVRVIKGGKILRDIEEGACFGEASLILDEPHSANIIATRKSKLFILSKEDFYSTIDKNMMEFLIKKISLQDDFATNLEDLHFIKSLGEGKFGYVSLVHNNKNYYAIKAVNKKSAEKQKILVKYLQKEREILLSLDHPLIVKLVKTMKNDDFIFYLLEFVQGSPLSHYLEGRKLNKEKRKYETQFYISTLLIIINYLNTKKVAHRDIKPDNIMIDEKGYLKLIDFGTAVLLKDFTNTIVGTPHYMAPEILNGKGYGFSADYWSVGITAYEIYFNKFPFGQDATDPLGVYKEILKK